MATWWSIIIHYLNWLIAYTGAWDLARTFEAINTIWCCCSSLKQKYFKHISSETDAPVLVDASKNKCKIQRIKLKQTEEETRIKGKNMGEIQALILYEEDRMCFLPLFHSNARFFTLISFLFFYKEKMHGLAEPAIKYIFECYEKKIFFSNTNNL